MFARPALKTMYDPERNQKDHNREGRDPEKWFPAVYAERVNDPSRKEKEGKQLPDPGLPEYMDPSLSS